MPAMLEDPLTPTVYRTSGAPPYPSPLSPSLPESITPRLVTLRDRVTTASLIPFSTSSHVPNSLLTYLCAQLNLEIEKGDTYPMMLPMDVEAFGKYWFQNFGAVMLLGEINVDLNGELESRGDWERVCLGSFYVKPNYPGRSSHVCNGGFLVTDAARNRGVGRLMGEGYLEWAPQLGYTYSVFNLVYETNVASCRIWDALGFKRIGRVKSCGNLRSYPHELVDAIIYGRDLGPEGEDFVSEERFDKIRFYLKHAKYPNGADRAEKSRLRSAATHYKLLPPAEDGEMSEGGERLMLKDKEVVADPQRQYEIARMVHKGQHGGINKTTATIAEKYHWVRIKETVSLVIKNCPDCKESVKAPTVRPAGEQPSSSMSTTMTAAAASSGAAQLRKAATVGVVTDPNSMIERLVNFSALPGPPTSSSLHPQPPQQNPTASHSLLHHHQSTSSSSSSSPNPNPNDNNNEIPLDPQILHQSRTHPHHNHPQPFANNPTNHPPSPSDEDRKYAELAKNFVDVSEDVDVDGDNDGDGDFEMDLHDDAQPRLVPPRDDTRIATERHIRNGDEPMGFVGAEERR